MNDFASSLEVFASENKLLTLAIVAAVTLGGPQLKAMLLSVVASIKAALSGIQPAPTPSPLPQPVNPGSDVAAAIASLQTVTLWAVKNGSPEILAKVTSLYQDLAAKEKAT